MNNFGSSRQALSEGTEVNEYKILELLGMGASCIVYKVSYGTPEQYAVMKEFYPSSGFDIKRNNDNSLTECSDQAYKRRKDKFISGYDRIADMLRNDSTKAIDQFISLPIKRFQANNTEYQIFTLINGHTYSKWNDSSLSDVFKMAIALSKSTRILHEAGFYHLDIKADNVYIVPDPEDYSEISRIMLFDFDSLVPISELKQTDSSVVISCTPDMDSIYPEELKNADIKGINDTTDMFLIAALILKRIAEYDMDTMGAIWDTNVFKQFRKNDLFKKLKPFGREIAAHEICAFFEKALNNFSCTERYENWDSFIDKLEEIKTLCDTVSADMYDKLLKKGFSIEVNDVTELFLRLKSFSIFETRSEDKFKLLNKNNILESYVRSGECPYDEPKPTWEAVLDHNRIVITGQGGIGKSAAIYKYWRNSFNTTEIIFFVELHNYSPQVSLSKTGGTHSDFIVSDIIKQLFDDETTKDISHMHEKHILEMDKILCTYDNIVLFLDGMNEINEAYLFDFYKELDYISKRYKIRIVLSSRTVPENFKEFMGDSFMEFRMLPLTEKIVENVLKSNSCDECNVEKIMRNNKLIKLLQIPIYLTMFINSSKDSGLITRSEIINEYICGRDDSLYNEHNSSQRISCSRELVRKDFIREYILPCIASFMDSSASFGVTGEDIGNAVKKTIELYIYDDIPSNFFSGEYQFQLTDAFPDNENEKKRRLEICRYIIGIGYMYGDEVMSFSHELFRDFFAAKHIINILKLNKCRMYAGSDTDNKAMLAEINRAGLNYPWTDEVCLMVNEMS